MISRRRQRGINQRRSESAVHLRNFVVALVLAIVATSTAIAQAQDSQVDPTWKTRFTALQDEQDAQSGTAIFIVFDDSGSMNDDNKLVMAKKSFRAWIEHAPTDYRFSLTALNAGPLVNLARNNRQQILAAVDKLRASGSTPLADTIARVHNAITRYRASGALYVRQVVVILTDGEDNTKRGDQGVRDEMNRLRVESVEVIAFGYKGEADYLNGAATRFYSPNNGQDISQGLNAISAEVRDTSDLLVDDATRTLMATLPAVTSMRTAPVSTPTVTPASSASATPWRPAGKSSGLSWKFFIAITIVVFVLRGILAGGKKKAKRRK